MRASEVDISVVTYTENQWYLYYVEKSDRGRANLHADDGVDEEQHHYEQRNVRQGLHTHTTASTYCNHTHVSNTG